MIFGRYQTREIAENRRDWWRELSPSPEWWQVKEQPTDDHLRDFPFVVAYEAPADAPEAIEGALTGWPAQEHPTDQEEAA